MVNLKKTREKIDADFDALVSAMHSPAWAQLSPEQHVLRNIQKQGVTLLTPEEVCSMRAAPVADPSLTLKEEYRRGEVIGIHIKSEWRYPDFQFDQNGMVKPSTLAFMKYILDSGGQDRGGWSVLSWLVGRNKMLEDSPPFQLLDSRLDDVNRASRIFFSLDD